MKLRHALSLAVAVTAARCTGQTFTSGITTGTVADTTINEDSGIAASRMNPNVLWTQEDSGNPADIYAMTPAGTSLGTYTISGASNTDWEDIDVGPGPVAGEQYVYVGDIGDNNLNRAKIEVYRVPEPVVSDTQASVTTTLTGAAKFTFVYPDGPHDAESMFVDPLTKDIYIITKRDATYKYVFEAPYPQSTSGTTTLTLVASLLNSTALTAADISPDGSEIIMRSYATSSGLLYHRPAGGTVADAFATTPVAIPLVSEQQGEGIGFDPQGRGYFTTSEGVSQPIHYFDLLPPPDANYYWDPDAVTAGNRTATGASMGGTGTWNGTNTKWYNGAANVTWQKNNDAVFWGSAGTVTPGSAQSVNSLSFKTTGYVLTSSTLTLTGPSVTVDSDVAATIASVVAGSVGLSKLGAGTLTLSGSNTYTGSTTIHAGTLVITADANLGSTASNITIDGGTLSLNNTSAINLNANRSITLGTNGGTINTNLSSRTISDGFSGPLIGSSSAVLTKTGNGNLFLDSNSSAYLGKWIINGGEVNPGNATTADAGWGAVPSHFVSDFITLDYTGTGGLAAIRAGAGAVYTLNANRGINLGAGGGSIDTVASSASLTIASVISGIGSLTMTTVNNPGTVTLAGANTYTGGTTASAGTLVLANSKALGSGGLAITNNALVKAIPSLGNPIALPSLAVATGAQLDLSNNDLILNYTGSSPVASIRSLLTSGFDSGTWNGEGIASSAAAADTNFRTGLGYAEASQLGLADGGSFKDQAIADQAIIVKYTYYGDNDLDGKVTLNDFSIFIDGFNGLGSGWVYGDYNYSGTIDLSDFALFVDAFKNQGAPLSSLDDSILSDPSLSAAQKNAMLSVVPEPGTLALVAAAFSGMMMRCRRLAV